MDLTDAQWAVLGPLFRPKRRADGRGRPWQDTRAVLNGVFWVLRTGLLGTICRLAILPIRPVIDASNTGSAVGC
jgi:transposase